MKAFVTGGTGFIGGRVIEKLRERGDQVVALVRSTGKAQRLTALGCELVPGGVYGPGDHSEVGNMIDQTRSGKLRAVPFPKLGLNLVHVEDVADGILLAHDRGQIGEPYVLGGEISTMRGLVEQVARIEGRKPPKANMPTAVIRMAIPFGPVVGKLMGFPPNFRELISASDGVTYWARDDKARGQLGYSPRELEQGLRETLAAQAAI